MDSGPVSISVRFRQAAPLVFVGLMLAIPAMAAAGPAEEANAVVDRFSAAYTSNDPDAVVKLYAPDAILLGPVSSVISVGTEAIRKYFSMIKGSGNKNAIQERHTSCSATTPWSSPVFTSLPGCRRASPCRGRRVSRW